MTDPNALLTLKEAASEVRRDPETIRRWVREARVVYERMGRFGQIMIRRSALWAAMRADYDRKLDEAGRRQN